MGLAFLAWNSRAFINQIMQICYVFLNKAKSYKHMLGALCYVPLIGPLHNDSVPGVSKESSLLLQAEI